MTMVLSCVAGYTTVVHVEVDEQTSQGQEDVEIPVELFHGSVPIPFCVLQGFHTKLNLGKSQSVSRFFHNWAIVTV